MIAYKHTDCVGLVFVHFLGSYLQPAVTHNVGAPAGSVQHLFATSSNHLRHELSSVGHGRTSSYSSGCIELLPLSLGKWARQAACIAAAPSSAEQTLARHVASEDLENIAPVGRTPRHCGLYRSAGRLRLTAHGSRLRPPGVSTADRSPRCCPRRRVSGSMAG